MRIPLEWLQEYVSVHVEPRILAHDLTMLGTKIEGLEEPKSDIDGVQVGKVLESTRHPNADKLSLCRVDVGGEQLRIVCGAANVRPGLTVAVARIGARLADGHKIRKSKIRGEVSEGMLCSARELGLGMDADGILELDPALPSGAPFRAAGETSGVVLEAEITPNRPDCLALLGVAREVAALYEEDLQWPRAWSEEPARREPAVQVTIENEVDCERYLARTLRGVRLAPSPSWLQRRLSAMGLEPINNVVDVTNYVMFETGQPIHAFDLGALSGGKIFIRRARSGEKLRALDGVEHELDSQILVIADAAGPVALAGIMGGAASAVQSATRDLLLEVAAFRPGLVRSGRRQLGVDTESSYRFERQTDVEAVRWVADRATRLLLEVAGGEVSEATVDVYPQPPVPRHITLRCQRANQLIGTKLAPAEIGALLERLHLPVRVQGESVEIQVPSFRRDLHTEIDLIEEVARMYGYDNIPSDVLPPAPLQPQDPGREQFRGTLRDTMVGLGYFEVKVSAFMERQDPERLLLPHDDRRRRAVCLRNPLVPTLDTMRTSLVPGMLRILRHNLNREAESLRLVAVDRVFLDEPGGEEGLPHEPERLVAVLCGSGTRAGWNEVGRAADLFDLKGDAEALLEQLGVDTVWSRGYTEPFLDSAASFLISGSYGAMGGGGTVQAEVLRRFEVDVPVFLLELDVGSLERHLPGRRMFRGIPRFPAIKRDLSLLAPLQVTFADLHALVTQVGGELLESVQCFDVFEDPTLGEGTRSIGLRLRFRSPERTLLDGMVEPLMDNMVQRLQRDLGVTLRVA